MFDNLITDERRILILSLFIIISNLKNNKIELPKLSLQLARIIIYDYIRNNHIKFSVDIFIASNNWDQTQLIKWGSKIIQFFINQNVLELQLNDKGNTVLNFTETYISLASKFETFLFTTIPMLVPPIPWSFNTYGGFLTNYKLHLPLIHIKYSDNHVTSINNDIYTSVNKLASTPFLINIKLLNYLINHPELYSN